MCVLVALPGACLAFCGATSGAIITAVCGLGGREKLSLRGSAVRPHLGAVTALAASHDESLLISGGADGSIFVFERAVAAASVSAEPGTADELALAATVPAEDGGFAGAPSMGGGRFDDETEVQCVSRASLERAAHELALSKSAVWQLQASVRTEAARAEARVATMLSQQAREHAETLAEFEKRERRSIAENNAEVAALHRRFSEYASRLEEAAKVRQSQLEATLRSELVASKKVGDSLVAVREQAAKDLEVSETMVAKERLCSSELRQQMAEMAEEAKAGCAAADLDARDTRGEPPSVSAPRPRRDLASAPSQV